MRCRRVQESNMVHLKGQLLGPLLFLVFINDLLRVITAILLIVAAYLQNVFDTLKK